MIDASLSNNINQYNERAQDALGYNIPGYQPKFHDVLRQEARSIKSFDPLSVVAPDNTYFVVDNGDGSHAYSRGGDFRVVQGRLVTRDGRSVLGYPNGIEKGTLAPITLPQGLPDGNVRIASDGTVSYGGATAADAGAKTAKGLGGAGSDIAAAHAAPVTDVSASENLAPPPASADEMVSSSPAMARLTAAANDDTKGYDVPNISLGSDPNVQPVSLPDEAGHLDPRMVLGQEVTPNNAPLGTHTERQMVNTVPGPIATASTDQAAVDSLTGGLRSSKHEEPTIGIPVGKVALARFASGTTVSNDGLATSGPPLEMGPPGNGKIAQLKTGYRDVGSVDNLGSKVALTKQQQVMYAMLQIETARQGDAKKAMDLIK